MIAAQRSSTGRIVSAFSDGRLVDTRFTPRSRYRLIRSTSSAWPPIEMSKLVRIAPRLGRHLAEARDQLGQRRRRSRGHLRHPAVAVADRAARAVGEGAADQDRRMRLLHRLRPGLHRIEIDELAVILGGRPASRSPSSPRCARAPACGAFRSRCRGSPSRPGSSHCRRRTRSARRTPGRSRPPASRSGSDRAARSGRRRCRPSASSSPPPPAVSVTNGSITS